MADTTRPDPAIPAENDAELVARLIGEYLEQVDRGDAPLLEAFCAGHARVSAHLRRGIHAVLQLGGAREDPPGTLGDYRLLRRLGAGAMGEVYLAVQESLRRRVALKLVRPDLLADPRALARFRREVEAAARLQHPGIVAVHTFGEEGGTPYCAMEYVEGGTLADVLSRVSGRHPSDLCPADLFNSPQPDTRTGADARWRGAAIGLVRDLARALQHAHDKGVVHRDIKPGNILLGVDGRARLADFGLARLVDQLAATRTGTLVGTPQYMSPEQVDPDREAAGPASDIYSLGVVLYQLLTLRLPFTGDRLADLFHAILTRDPVRPRKLDPDLDADLEAVVLRALEKEPARRYVTAGAFADDLDRVLAGRATEARPLGRVGRVRRAWHRLGTAALALCALLVATTWFVVDAAGFTPAPRFDVNWHVWRALGAVAAAAVTVPIARQAARRFWPAKRLAPHAVSLVVLAGAGTAIGSIWQAHVGDAAFRALRTNERVELALLLDSVRETVPAPAGEAAAQRVREWSPELSWDDHVVVARCFLASGRLADAGAHIEALSRLDERNPAAVALRAMFLAMEGEHADAEALESALLSDQSGRHEDRHWLAAGVVLGEHKRWSLAEAAFTRALAAPGARKSEAALGLASTLMSLCRYREAQDLALSVPTGTSDAELFMRTRIALASGDKALAERLMAGAARFARGSNAQRLAWTTTEYERLGRPHAWLASLVEDRNADFVVIHWAAATAYLARKFDDARDWYSLVVSKADANSEAGLIGLSQIGRAACALQLRKGNWLAEADGDIRSALLNPVSASAWEAHYAQFLHAYRSREEACKQAGIGFALEQDDLTQMISMLERARRLSPMNSMLLNEGADLWMQLSRRTQDMAGMARATAMAKHLIWHDERLLSDAGNCEATDLRARVSIHYTTLSEIREAADMLGDALDAARRALELLPAGHPTIKKRAARVEMLQSKLEALHDSEPRSDSR